jgi:hypothetical protein
MQTIRDERDKLMVELGLVLPGWERLYLTLLWSSRRRPGRWYYRPLYLGRPQPVGGDYAS